MSVSVVSDATVNLLVDFDRAEIRNKEDEICLERTVISSEIHNLESFA